MKRIYIAGPMSGLADFNYPAFHEAEARLLEEGKWIPISPARQYGGRQDLPYDAYIRGALQMLLISDAILMLPGWEESKGALLEKHTAEVLGLGVFYV